MQLQDVLYSQGFGTRRVCAGLIQQGLVQIHGEAPGGELQTVTDAAFDVTPQGLRVRVQGVDWPYHEKAYLMLHKPSGTECSQKPSTYPSIYTLLPSPLRMRPQKAAVQGVQAVGRLDQDTTGLLLLSDDGQLNHVLSSGKRKVPKTYLVKTRHVVDQCQVEHLLAGVSLHGEPQPIAAAVCGIVGEYQLRLTVTEGKYHQVKRMVAAAGNRVEGLHREAIGGFALPPELEPGEWRWLCASERQQLGVSV